jgi:hypothetical protein
LFFNDQHISYRFTGAGEIFSVNILVMLYLMQQVHYKLLRHFIAFVLVTRPADYEPVPHPVRALFVQWVEVVKRCRYFAVERLATIPAMRGSGP